MLIIPALHIHKGRCVRTAQGEAGTEGSYPMEPVAVARLWRGENAKALHVVGLDIADGGLRRQLALLKSIVDAVDIPVQLAGHFSSIEDIAAAFDEAGASRVVVPASFVHENAILRTVLERFGSRKIVLEIEVDSKEIISGGSTAAYGEAVLSRANGWKQLGLQRIVVSDTGGQNSLPAGATQFLLSIVERTNLSVKLNGFIRNYKDLKLLQNLHPRKIDSIILDEALYSNAFPCQKIWRKAEQQLIAQHKLL